MTAKGYLRGPKATELSMIICTELSRFCLVRARSKIRPSLTPSARDIASNGERPMAAGFQPVIDRADPEPPARF
jgi:hypothetical protein